MFVDMAFLTADPVFSVKREPDQGHVQYRRLYHQLDVATLKDEPQNGPTSPPQQPSLTALQPATSIPKNAPSIPSVSDMHLSQAPQAASGYDPQDFIPTGDPSQYPTPTHTYFPPAPPSLPPPPPAPPPPPPPPSSVLAHPDAYYTPSSYSARHYDNLDKNQVSTFHSPYSATTSTPGSGGGGIYQHQTQSQYTPMETLVGQKQEVCFDQSGYRQMLGSMMNHLVPPSSQLCQVAKESLRQHHQQQQRGPQLSMVSRSLGGAAVAARAAVSAAAKVTNDVTAMKEKTPCDICGDVSAGFHCNAYVCEACKKFFIRSSKNENYAKYSCSKVNACEVNKDTRTHCQRCRFYKCLRIGMVLPGAAVCPANDISIIPCRVCGAQSSGFHFGAITCEGCKGFFRRTISERDNQRYTCRNGGTCLVTLATRNNCKSCRYRKCLSVGMSKDGSRIGRQPNAVKHMCAIEIERIKSKMTNAAASSSNQTPPPPPPPPLLPPHNQSAHIAAAVASSSSTYYEPHFRSLQQHYTSMKMEDTSSNTGVVPPDLLFPSWTPSVYGQTPAVSGYYETALPDISAISAGTTGATDSSFAKLAELAGAMDTYGAENRYGGETQRHRSSSDTSQIGGGDGGGPGAETMGGLMGGGPQQQQQQQQQQQAAVAANGGAASYESSSTVISTYEQAALSSLIRLAKQVQSASTTATSVVTNVNVINAATTTTATQPSSSSSSSTSCNEPRLSSTSAGDQAFPPISSLQASGQAQHPAQRLRPSSNGRLQSMEEEEGGPEGVCPISGENVDAGAGSSPEDEAGKLINRSNNLRHMALPVGEKEGGAAFGFAENNYATDDYLPIGNPYSSQKLFESASQNHNGAPMELELPPPPLLPQPSVSFSPQMTLETFTEYVAEAGVYLEDCRRRVTGSFLLDSEVLSPAAAMWDAMMAQFEAHARQVIRFARAIPGFCDLPRDDTKFLVQASMYPIVLVQLAREPLPGGEFNFYNFVPRERRLLLTEFPQLNPLADHFYELTGFLGSMNLDNTEVALLCSIIFLRGSNQKLLEAEKIYEIYNHAASALQQYIAVRYSSDERFTHLIKLLPSLSSMNEAHRAAVRELRQSRPDLRFPDLFVQMFQLDGICSGGGGSQSGALQSRIDIGDSGLVNSSQ